MAMSMVDKIARAKVILQNELDTKGAEKLNRALLVEKLINELDMTVMSADVTVRNFWRDKQLSEIRHPTKPKSLLKVIVEAIWGD